MSVTETAPAITAMPRIGDKAPDFDALTTFGQLNFGEYRKDSWAILFSHPADFTPVCTTELVEFAREIEYFTQHNTKLIGVSVDSIHSHIAWVENVRKNMGVTLDFPIVADISMNVSQRYGMLHPGESATATVRAVFIIDPKGIIRLIVYYPLNVGRNLDEIKRVLIALQTVDANGVACPVNWQEGDKVIVPAPKTLKELQERDNTPHEKIDFYLVKRSLN